MVSGDIGAHPEESPLVEDVWLNTTHNNTDDTGELELLETAGLQKSVDLFSSVDGLSVDEDGILYGLGSGEYSSGEGNTCNMYIKKQSGQSATILYNECFLYSRWRCKLCATNDRSCLG